MATSRPSLYREVLTPAFHRRFTESAVLVLLFCYIEGVLIAEKTSILWVWFPIGPAAFRSLLLFISALSIFVLRVSALHLGSRTSPFPANAFVQSVFSFGTITTFAWYIFSAWWFSEVYIFSASTSPDLGWTIRGKVSERNRLNERAIYFRFYTFLLALVQGLVHLYCDYDELALPVGAVNNSAVNSDSQGLQAGFLARVDNLLPMFTWDSQNWVRSIPQNIFLRTLAVSLSTPIVYQTFFRRWVWELALSVASLLWDVPLTPFSFLPPMYPSLIQYSFTAGLQVMFLWQSSNALFTAYVAQQPIKREQPLSSDSKDPTGTLLNGLRSKKETPKTFACWELSLITSNFPDRRKAIFTDIDRLSGPAWTQILSQCLANISSISVRIDSYLNPPAPSPPSSEEKALADRQAAAAVQSLPRISTPIQEGHVFMKPAVPSTKTKKVERGVGNLAKSYGQSTSPGTLKIPYLSPQAKSRLISSSKDLFSPNIRKFFAEQKDNHSPQGLRGTAQEYTMRFLRSKFGTPFRTTFSRRISTVVLGTPYSTLYSTITSIQSLAALAIASLDEDPYGRVSKDVPTLIRTFTRTAQDIEAFTKNLPPHWTDVEFKEDDRHVRDVETVVECLKIGLRDMVNAFGKYTKELGLQHDEMEVVRKVAGIGEEMRTVNGGI